MLILLNLRHLLICPRLPRHTSHPATSANRLPPVSPPGRRASPKVENRCSRALPLSETGCSPTQAFRRPAIPQLTRFGKLSVHRPPSQNIVFSSMCLAERVVFQLSSFKERRFFRRPPCGLTGRPVSVGNGLCWNRGSAGPYGKFGESYCSTNMPGHQRRLGSSATSFGIA